MRNDELYHYGILGMKWGVRRYQNEDGTLTEKGKKRYSKSKKEDYKSMSDEELKKRVQRLEMEQQYNRLNEPGSVRGIRNISRAAGSISKIRGLSNKKETQDISNTFKKGSEGSGKIADTLSKKMSNKKASEMSDAELKARVDRLNLEQRYRNRSRGAKASGAEWVLNTLDTIGDITAVGVSAVTLYKLIKKRTGPGITIQLSDENDDFLRHFGIKGQKWGRKHGPPYPLDYEDHTDKQKKENPKSILNGEKWNKKERKPSKLKQKSEAKRKEYYDAYRKRGYSDEAAKEFADNEMKARKALMIIGGVTVAAAVGFTAYKVGRKIAAKQIETKGMTIKVGDVLGRVSTEGDGKLYDSFYAAHDKLDRVRYKGMLGLTRQVQNPEGNVYETTMNVVKDIKIPDKQTAINTFEKLYNNDRDFRSTADAMIQLNRSAGMRQPSDSLPKMEKMYEQFNGALWQHGDVLGYGHDPDKTAKKFYNALKAKGYSGVIDINDRKYSGYNAKAPVIVFDNTAVAIDKIKKMDLRNYARNLAGYDVVDKGAKYAVATGLVSAAVVNGNKDEKQTELMRKYKKKRGSL